MHRHSGSGTQQPRLVRVNALRPHHRHQRKDPISGNVVAVVEPIATMKPNSCRPADDCAPPADVDDESLPTTTRASSGQSAAECVALARSLVNGVRADALLVHVVGALLATVLAICLIASLAMGIVVLACFAGGSAIGVYVVQNRSWLVEQCSKRWQLDALLSSVRIVPREESYEDDDDADAPEPFSAETLAKEPWKAIRIDSNLDRAVDSFFSRILNTFIDSWYGDITADEQFVLAIRQHLREALSRLLMLVRGVDIPALITDRLLPVCFAHFDLVERLMAADVDDAGDIAHDHAERLTAEFHAAHTVHPAVRNRRAERNYLRSLAAFLVPRLCPNAQRGQALRSPVFGSLLRELFAQWALLPLMDVLSDPDLINLLVLIASNRSSRPLGALSIEGRVEFLGRFVRPHRRTKRGPLPVQRPAPAGGDLLTDQTQMYSFMQYLKREGAVDVLRFFLDVDALNADLLDPKVTTDPAKLSSLQQQSEKLLQTYRQMQTEAGCGGQPVRTLAEAHELVRTELLGRWQAGFRGTAEYFRIVYGGREAKEADETPPDSALDAGGFRLGSKLKGALLRSAIETGATVDSLEAAGPLEWDAFGDEAAGGGGAQSLGGTGKRRERHHRLDRFVGGFMQSIEHTPELGIDAASGEADGASAPSRPRSPRKRTPPGRNPTFGDLFRADDDAERKIVGDSMVHDERTRGAIGCLIFVLVRILNAPQIVVRMALAIVAMCRGAVERVVRHAIEQVLRLGVYEPRLTLLITTLENHLFDGKKNESPGQTELRERRRQARQRLSNMHRRLPRLLDVLQAPALNKQLMYTLLDVVLVELWPELHSTDATTPSSSSSATTTTKRTPHHPI